MDERTKDFLSSHHKWLYKLCREFFRRYKECCLEVAIDEDTLFSEVVLPELNSILKRHDSERASIRTFVAFCLRARMTRYVYKFLEHKSRDLRHRATPPVVGVDTDISDILTKSEDFCPKSGHLRAIVYKRDVVLSLLRGNSVSSIAAEKGVSERTIRRILKRAILRGSQRRDSGEDGEVSRSDD